jgi:hypothetical protein
MVGDLGVAGEGIERAPQPLCVGPLQGFDVALRLNEGQVAFH